MILNRRPATAIRYAIAFSFAALLGITSVVAQTNRAGQKLPAYLNWPSTTDGFFSSEPLKDKTTATVAVDCPKGECINDALTHRDDASALEQIRGKVRELTRRFPLPN